MECRFLLEDLLELSHGDIGRHPHQQFGQVFLTR
jgi:hypothetical protein